MTKQKIMDTWYNAEDEAGFSGVHKLMKRTKKSKKETTEWLRKQMAYSLNMPMRRRFTTRKYKTNGPDDLWQADLLEMIPYASINDGNKYILTCIDVFSRFGRAIPLKSKSMKDVSEALLKLFKSKHPINFQTDLGKEFYNSQCKTLFEKYDINHYSVTSQFKAALVERFNRTIREKLNKYFTWKGNKKWLNVLPSIIKSYNNSKHRGIDKFKPVNVYTNKDDSIKILLTRVRNGTKSKKPKFNIGSYVRISKITISPFVKNFDQNWSDEIFQIESIDTQQKPVMYTIRDDDGEIIKGKFYEQELQLLPEKPSVYRIQSVIDRKGKGRNKQLLVKWVGYKKPEWIYEHNLI